MDQKEKRVMELLGIDLDTLREWLGDRAAGLSTQIKALELAERVAELEEELQKRETHDEEEVDENKERVDRVNFDLWDELADLGNRKISARTVRDAIDRALATDPPHEGDSFLKKNPLCQCNGCK